jgi:4-hydroxybenzoate polyprenyltransferase
MQNISQEEVPVYVDLDRTLIRTDLLVEAVACLARTKPWKLPLLGWYLLIRGKAATKAWLADLVLPDPALLPYNKTVLDLIEEKRKRGLPVILATASNRRYAEAVAAHLGVFDEVLASSESVNLKGEEKLAAIHANLRKRGLRKMDYVGDCVDDVCLFQASRKGYLFSHQRRWSRRFLSAHKNVSLIGSEPPRTSEYIRSLRPHQWSKNILILLPVFLAHQWTNTTALLSAFVAAILFNITASGVYLLNDFIDVERDRKHPTKRHRPLASGALPLHYGPLGSMLLFILAFTSTALLTPPFFLVVLFGYVATNFCYTFWLKNKPVIDVILLTLMYVFRIVAGGVATGLYVSDWLMSFSLFLFLSLAFGKRYQEICAAQSAGAHSGRIRGYVASDIRLIEVGGVGSGLLASLVLTLYIRNPEVTELYSAPRILWFMCPLILYWIGRFWIVCFRGEMKDDPVVFAMKDPISYCVAGCSLAIILFAKFSWISF